MIHSFIKWLGFRWSNKVVETFSSQIGFVLINVCSGIIISRGLGPEGRGQFVAITMWSNLLFWILNVNLYQTVIYFWKLHRQNTRGMFNTFVVYAFFGCTLAFIVAEFVVIPLILPNSHEEIVMAARIYFLVIYYASVSDVLMGALASEERFRYANISRILAPFATTLVILILYLNGHLDIKSALYTSFSVSTALFVLCLYWSFKLNFFSGSVSWEMMLHAFKYGGKSHIGTMAGVFSHQSSQIILSLFFPSSLLGLYSTAQSATAPLNTVTSTINILTQPRLTAERPRLIHYRVVHAVKITAFFLGAGAAVLAGSIPFLLPLVYGESFKAAVIPAILLVPSIICVGMSNVFRHALNGIGKTFVSTKIELFVLFYIIPTLLFSGYFFGITGIAVATLSSSVLRLVLNYMEYRHHFLRYCN